MRLTSDSWVVVPCPRSRLDELRSLLAQLDQSPHRVVVVTTLPDPIGTVDIAGFATHLVLFERPGMWFSAWVNAGLNYIDQVRAGAAYHPPFNVLVIGSDARGTKDSVEALANAMDQRNLVMCGPNYNPRATGVDILNDRPRTVHDRVPGSCFMLAGEYGLRMDEQFRWWYSDDDLEMQARAAGQVALVADTGLMHDTDHMLNAEQAEHAIEDRIRFVIKHSIEPW